MIKGKRLNKLESLFSQEAGAEDTDVTEEEESNDEEEAEENDSSKVRPLFYASQVTLNP